MKIKTIAVLLILTSTCQAAPSRPKPPPIWGQNINYRKVDDVTSPSDPRLLPAEKSATEKAIEICQDILSRDWKKPQQTYTELLVKYRAYLPGHDESLESDLDENLNTAKRFILSNTRTLYFANSCAPKSVTSNNQYNVEVTVCYTEPSGGLDSTSGKSFSQDAFASDSCLPVTFYLIKETINSDWRLLVASGALTPVKKRRSPAVNK